MVFGSSEKNISNIQLTAICVFLGFVYPFVLEHGLYSIWVFPYTFLCALLLRSFLVNSIFHVSSIESKEKQSKVMTLRLLGITFFQSIVCVSPFLFALFLNHFGFDVASKDVGVIDKDFYLSGLFAVPEKLLSREEIEYSGVNQIVLGCFFFLHISAVIFFGFAFKRAREARKLIYNTQIEFVSRMQRYYNEKAKLPYEFGLVLYSYFFLFVSVKNILQESYSLCALSGILFLMVFIPVFTAIYVSSGFVVDERKAVWSRPQKEKLRSRRYYAGVFMTTEVVTIVVCSLFFGYVINLLLSQKLIKTDAQIISYQECTFIGDCYRPVLLYEFYNYKVGQIDNYIVGLPVFESPEKIDYLENRVVEFRSRKPYNAREVGNGWLLLLICSKDFLEYESWFIVFLISIIIYGGIRSIFDFKKNVDDYIEKRLKMVALSELEK